MLVPLVITLALACIGTLIVAKVAFVTMSRLGLELETVLEWLGLAESPVDELTAFRLGLRVST